MAREKQQDEDRIEKLLAPARSLGSDEAVADLRVRMGRRIRVARAFLDLKQRHVASAFGKQPGWVASIELGDALAPPYLILGLHRVTGWPLAWFYGEGPDVPPTGEAQERSA